MSAAIVGLVQFGGRVHVGAILHPGPRLKSRDAWCADSGLGAPLVFSG